MTVCTVRGPDSLGKRVSNLLKILKVKVFWELDQFEFTLTLVRLYKRTLVTVPETLVTYLLNGGWKSGN